MHRLAAVPGDPGEAEAGALVEQPPAPVVLLSSADTDLAAIAALLQREPARLGAELRALNLAVLGHPAAVDHYLATTLAGARLVLVRLLGGRGHWSYGLERLRDWQAGAAERRLVVMAGTADEEEELASLGSVAAPLAVALARCLREGGEANLLQVLDAAAALLRGEEPEPPQPRPAADPLPHDWRAEPGARVGVILYRAQWQAGDRTLADATGEALRRAGLCPRVLWVSSLRDAGVQRGVADLLARERVEAVLCATGFASVRFEEAGLGAPLWERLGVPVLQLLTSARPRERWQRSSIGLGPLDLSLQVALPELDGRITTRVGAFKEMEAGGEALATALHRHRPDPDRLAWVADLTAAWTRLRRTPAGRRRVALVLANYPNRNGRLANGVGLDTPASAALMLRWLAESGHSLADPGLTPELPADGDALLRRLLQGRSNDPESGHLPPLDHLPLATYRTWYDALPADGRARLEAVWGAAEDDASLEATAAGPAFPIRGLRFGRVALLIQPGRGYDRDPERTYHSPDLPPTHAYLAQYLWLRSGFGAQVVVHVGKHGNLEWLPGKGVGLSAACFPEWALGPLPHLYPFIVNDPGEGSQAKRRSQAVILDHLTPPLGRAGLHGDLRELEALRLPGAADEDPEARLEAADGYLCELKEAQIRLGLHTFGTLPEPGRLAELALCLARPPQGGRPGLTQALAHDLGLDCDPWADPEEAALGQADRVRLAAPGESPGALRRVGDGVARLEARALELVAQELAPGAEPGAAPGPATAAALEHLRRELLPRLLACGEAERRAFLEGVAGGRIAAGPSGAPTRGRPELLPTGRNFYSVDLRGLPTEAAWDLGRRSAELLLELHLQEEGEDLRTLALSVWGTATMRNGGEDIAQALALMGVRPCWDGPTRRMVGVEAVPAALLGRPRVDVTLRISGLFRDAFPQLVSWFNRACALVAGLEEPDTVNPLAAAGRREGHAGRVYGSAPGAYGAGLQALIDSGQWEERGDLAQAFLAWSGWRYDEGGGGGIEAVADREGLERRLAATQVVLHNQDNREHDLLDSDDYYQFQGGLSAAVESLRGERPALWFGDHSRHQRPRLHRLEREFDKVLRSRLLNPRWIGAMLEHGYKGGFEMAASRDYLFAYDAATGRMPSWSYGAISDRWLGDDRVVEQLTASNPWALRDMAERLLEAHHRGLWRDAGGERLARLRQLVLSTEARLEGG
ncbi:MAG: cobaltochelatase subunit CobN [Synechococcaceae cyanobacterium]|nr:cobaltochelatase subunit CobN [Synechococcaceae cyanobacterium]